MTLKHADAEINGDKLYLNGGWKVLISVMIIFTSSVTAYAFWGKFPDIENRINNLEEAIHEIDVVSTKQDLLMEDIREFKKLLKRSVQ